MQNHFRQILPCKLVDCWGKFDTVSVSWLVVSTRIQCNFDLYQGLFAKRFLRWAVQTQNLLQRCSQASSQYCGKPQWEALRSGKLPQDSWRPTIIQCMFWLLIILQSIFHHVTCSLHRMWNIFSTSEVCSLGSLLFIQPCCLSDVGEGKSKEIFGRLPRGCWNLTGPKTSRWISEHLFHISQCALPSSWQIEYFAISCNEMSARKFLKHAGYHFCIYSNWYYHNLIGSCMATAYNRYQHRTNKCLRRMKSSCHRITNISKPPKPSGKHYQFRHDFVSVFEIGCFQMVMILHLSLEI